MHVLRDNIRIAYEEHGEGEQVFLFVHGWTCNREHFKPQASHFSTAGFRTISVDLRGHGQSDVPEDGYSIQEFSEDLAFLIDNLSLPRLVAVGHSMGALIVLQLAALQPEAIEGIVMIDPAPLSYSEAMRHAVEEMGQELRAGSDKKQREFLNNLLFLPTDDPSTKSRIIKQMCDTPKSVAVQAMQALLDFDGIKIAEHCQCPALHIAAEPPLNAPESMKKILPGIINAKTVGAGHFNQLLVPNQVNAMISRFTEVYLNWN